MMGFTSLSRAEQRYEVAGALAIVLAALDRVAPTVVVVGRVARALGADAREVTGLVIAIAQEGHPRARKDGATFKRYGKTMRRWNWYPASLPAASAPEPAPAANALPDYSTLTLSQLGDMLRAAVEGSLEYESVLDEMAARADAPKVDDSGW